MDPVVSKNAPPKPSKEVKPGNLKFTLVEARNLAGKKGEWLSPYCQLGPVDDEGNLIPSKTIKTEIIRRTQRPTWNQTYNFPISPQFKGLLLECWDDGKKQRFMGRVEFPPQILLDGRELTTWFSFSKREGKQYVKEVVKGEVYLSLLYLSNELRKELDPEGWAAEQAAAAAAAAAAAGEGGGSKIQAKAKRPEQLDDLLSEVRASKIDAIKALTAFILQTSYLNSTEENLDHEYAKIAIEKGSIDAVLQGLRGDTSEFRYHACGFLGRLSDLDTETLELLASKNVGHEVLGTIMDLPHDETLILKVAPIFSLSRSAAIKKEWVDGGLLSKTLATMKEHNHTSPVISVLCKSITVITEGDHPTCSKKEVAVQLIDAGAVGDLLGFCKSYQDKEEVVEQALPVLDTLVEFMAKCNLLGNEGVDLLLSLIQKHRFPIQVHCASVLAKMAEEDEYAKHIKEAGGIPVIVKLLGSESFLRSFEQKSREVCIKCLNRLVTVEDGISAIRDAGIAKILQPAIQPYGDKFIIQIQAILLIKALAKDEVCRQQLVQAGVSQLLASAAAKHTVTRLQKLVQELKETYLW